MLSASPTSMAGGDRSFGKRNKKKNKNGDTIPAAAAAGRRNKKKNVSSFFAAEVESGWLGG